MKVRILLAMLPVLLVGCVPTYTLQQPGPTQVALGGLTVQPSSAWNVAPRNPSLTKWEEVWTQNGLVLETVAFLSGVPDGKAIVVQRKKDEQQVPVFRANMSPEDLVSMLEASYRVKGITVFNVESVDPVDFLGGPGIRVRYNYAPGDGITKNGNCVMRIVDNTLYAMKLDGASSHYFSAAMPEFELLVNTAALAK